MFYSISNIAGNIARQLPVVLRGIAIPDSRLALIANICFAGYAVFNYVFLPLMQRRHLKTYQNQNYEMIFLKLIEAGKKETSLPFCDANHPLQKAKELLKDNHRFDLWEKLVLQLVKTETPEHVKDIIEAAPNRIKLVLYEDVVRFSPEYMRFSVDHQIATATVEQLLKSKQENTRRCLLVNEKDRTVQSLSQLYHEITQELQLIKAYDNATGYQEQSIAEHAQKLSSLSKEIVEYVKAKVHGMPLAPAKPELFGLQCVLRYKPHDIATPLLERAEALASEIPNELTKLRLYIGIYQDYKNNQDPFAETFWNQKIRPMYEQGDVNLDRFVTLVEAVPEKADSILQTAALNFKSAAQMRDLLEPFNEKSCGKLRTLEKFITALSASKETPDAFISNVIECFKEIPIAIGPFNRARVQLLCHFGKLVDNQFKRDFYEQACAIADTYEAKKNSDAEDKHDISMEIATAFAGTGLEITKFHERAISLANEATCGFEYSYENSFDALLDLFLQISKNGDVVNATRTLELMRAIEYRPKDVNMEFENLCWLAKLYYGGSEIEGSKEYLCDGQIVIYPTTNLRPQTSPELRKQAITILQSASKLIGSKGLSKEVKQRMRLELFQTMFEMRLNPQVYKKFYEKLTPYKHRAEILIQVLKANAHLKDVQEEIFENLKQLFNLESKFNPEDKVKSMLELVKVLEELDWKLKDADLKESIHAKKRMILEMIPQVMEALPANTELFLEYSRTRYAAGNKDCRHFYNYLKANSAQLNVPDILDSEFFRHLSVDEEIFRLNEMSQIFKDSPRNVQMTILIQMVHWKKFNKMDIESELEDGLKLVQQSSDFAEQSQLARQLQKTCVNVNHLQYADAIQKYVTNDYSATARKVTVLTNLGVVITWGLIHLFALRHAFGVR